MGIPFITKKQARAWQKRHKLDRIWVLSVEPRYLASFSPPVFGWIEAFKAPKLKRVLGTGQYAMRHDWDVCWYAYVAPLKKSPYAPRDISPAIRYQAYNLLLLTPAEVEYWKSKHVLDVTAQDEDSQ